MPHRLLLALAIGLTVAACGGGGSSPAGSTAATDRVALRVNGLPVMQSTLQLLARDLRFQNKPVTTRVVVGQAIDDALVTEQAARLHVAVTRQEVERAYRAAGGDAAATQLARFHIPLSHLRERVAHDLLARKLMARQFRNLRASDHQLRARYMRDLQQFHTPLLVRVSAIQVKDALQGRTVLRLLRQGRSFNALAHQFSPDPNGPDQGWKAPSKLPPRIGRLLAQTPVGKVVPTPVHVQASYLVIEITGRRGPRTAGFPEVRAAIRRVVDAELRGAAFLRWLRSARQAADVEYVTQPNLGS